MTQAATFQKRPARRWVLILPLLLAAVLLYAATRGVRWAEVAQTLKSCHVSYLLAGWALLTFSAGLRALRWRILLSANKPIAYAPVLWASLAGSLGNNYLPARAGEVIRSVYVSSVSGISKSFVLATAIGERMLDALILSAIGALSMTAMGTGSPALLRAAQLVAGGAVLGTLFIAMAPRFEDGLQRVFAKCARQVPLAAAIEGIARQFLLGMRAFHHLGRLCGFVSLSVATWLSDATAAVLIGMALDLRLSFFLALFLLAALGLSSGLPSTPGYLGIYQFVAVSVLVPFGFSRTQALAYIIAWQAAIYAMVTIWGGIGLWKLRGCLPAMRFFRRVEEPTQ